ncbi:MAG TPA: hypothetical protein VJ476_14130 [Rhizomicrobium sp.]|nr:hypothetical protein [Rhizomicrobium sp.]
MPIACAALAACSHNPAPPIAPPPAVVITLCSTGATAGLALCALLAKMDEPAPLAGGTRVLIAPAGQPALAIRVVGTTMTVKRLDRGKLDLTRSFELSDKERRALADAGAAWSTLPPNADGPVPCKTASYVAAETGAGADYKFSVAQCVALKPLRDLADAYLAIATEKVPELKQGLEQSLD